jgi:hypothetical protein
MPNVWLGSRTNPLFSAGLTGLAHEEDQDGSSYGDSLGDLSDFEDADFEAFADSLLENDALDEELFGTNKVLLGQRRSSANRESDLDSLSDFENDDDDAGGEGYLNLRAQVDDWDGSGNESPAQPADESATPLPRGGVGRASMISFDLDDEVVVTHATYDDIGQAWTTKVADDRANAVVELAAWEQDPTRKSDAVIKLFTSAQTEHGTDRIAAASLATRVTVSQLTDICGEEHVQKFRRFGSAGQVDKVAAIQALSPDGSGYVSVLDLIAAKMTADRMTKSPSLPPLPADVPRQLISNSGKTSPATRVSFVANEDSPVMIHTAARMVSNVDNEHTYANPNGPSRGSDWTDGAMAAAENYLGDDLFETDSEDEFVSI